MKVSFPAFTIFSLLLAVPLPATAADIAELAKQHRYPLQIDGYHLSGEGAERFLAEARDADIVMFGEMHGVREIAVLAQAMYLASSEGKARRLVTEIGPTTAEIVEQAVRAGEYRDLLAKDTNLQAVPFFANDEEIALLELAVARNPGARAIWGLDQEFMAGTPLFLDYLNAAARSDREKAAVTRFRRNAMFNPMLVGMGDGVSVRELKAAFADSSNPAARRLAEQLELSYRIYQANSHDPMWSNERRETLMFENFTSYVDAESDNLPPMFFKFGGFHVYRHRSPTVKEAALGLRVSRWAESRGLSTLNVYADCGPESETLEPFLGRATACEPLMLEHGKVFEDLLFPEGATLFDLRPLRAADGIDGMHWRIGMLVKAFDYLVLVPNAEAAHYAEGAQLTRRIAMAAVGALVLVLGLAGGLLIAWRKRRRHS